MDEEKSPMPPPVAPAASAPISMSVNQTLLQFTPLSFKSGKDLWWATQLKAKGVQRVEPRKVSSEDIAAFMRDGIFIPQE